jgi:hypothetical protein
MYATMKMDKNGKAMIKKGFPDIVQEFYLKEGDICSFTFKDERGSPFLYGSAWLKLVITKLKSEA